MSVRQGNKIIAGGGVNDIFPIGVPFPTPYTEDYIPEGFVPANGQEYKGDDYLDLWDNWLGKPAPQVRTPTPESETKDMFKWVLDRKKSEDANLPPDEKFPEELYTGRENPTEGDTCYNKDGSMLSLFMVEGPYDNESITVSDDRPWMAIYSKPSSGGGTTKPEIVGGKLQTITYEQFANEVAINGFCMKFAIDSNRKMFRVPQIPDGFTYNVPELAKVRGNGKALQITDGSTTGSWQANYTYRSSNVYASPAINKRDGNVGENIGGNNATKNNNLIGIATEGETGIVAEIKSSTSREAKWFIKLVNSTVTSSVFDYWNAIVTLQNKFQIVDQVPANPIPGVFYCIPEDVK